MITSTRHPLVQAFRRLGDHAGRSSDDRIILDGPRLIEEALGAGVVVEAALAVAAAASPVQALAARLRGAGARVHEAAPRVVQAASRVVATQGIVALARRPRPATDEVLQAPRLVLLVADRIQDPGNIGTIIRTSVAAGATAVALTEGTVDPYLPKVLRATMGAAFRIPILTIDSVALRSALAARNVRVLVADAHAATEYTQVAVGPPVAIVVGHETAGPDPAWAGVGTRVRIPLWGPVESLNVAVAAALLLYEVARRG
jgi:TrmH family RNA methyltransferase